MSSYFSRMKAYTESILTINFTTYPKKYRYLLILMLISLASIPKKSFSKDGYGNIQLCRSDKNNRDGVAIGPGGRSDIDCNDHYMEAFSLNSSGTALGSKEDSSNTRVIGYKDGTLKIIANKVMEVHGKLDMKNNSISQLKPGALSNNSKDAVNGSQLFKTNQDISKNGNEILNNKQSIEKNHNELSKAIDKTNKNIQNTDKELKKYIDNKSLSAEENANKYTDRKIIQVKDDVNDEFKRVNGDLIENQKFITKLTQNLNEGSTGLVRQSKTDGSITVAAETNGESVSVKGTSGTRFIRDVKAGVNNNDVVNVSQLNTLLSKNQISVAPTSSKEQVQADKKDGIAFGGGAQSTAEGAIAIGTESKASGERSTALGQQANSSGRDSLALGAGASAPVNNAVALGANSAADRNNIVSVGSSGHERQITNMAPGTHDTDAANIAQLNRVRSTATSAHGLAQKNTSRINNLENISKNGNEILNNKQSIEKNHNELSKAIDKTNKNIQNTDKELKKYIDNKSLSAEENANKYTDRKIIQVKDDVNDEFKRVNGDLIENQKFITKLTQNLNEGSTGLVRQSKTDGSITVAAETNGESVSVKGTSGTRFIRDVKAGVNNNDVVNVSQLNTLLSKNQISVAPTSSKEQVQADKKDGIAFGGGAQSTAEGAIAIGTESKASGERSTALGQQANSSGRDSLALGAGASAPVNNAVALGANSAADRNNIVSVGSSGHERQITNMAPGTHDTDAANIAQLNRVRSTATSAHGLAQKNTSRINNLENKLSKTNKKIDRGLAASAALTGLFQPYGVGNVNFTAGIGTYGYSVAMAIGSGYRINKHAAVKAGLAYSGGNNVTSNASFNLEW